MKQILIPKIEADPSLVQQLFASSHELKNDTKPQVLLVDTLPVTEQVRFSQPGAPDYSFMPKVENYKDLTYEIPNDCAQFAGAISLIAAYEHSTSPDAFRRMIEITVDQDRVEAGKSQRSATWHSDTSRWYSSRVYIVSDCYPTEFAPELGYEANPYEVTFMQGDVQHRSPNIPVETERTLLRVTYMYDLSEA